MKSWAIFVLLVLTTSISMSAQTTIDFLQVGQNYTDLFYGGTVNDIWLHLSPQMQNLFGNEDALLGMHLQMAGQFGVETKVIDERVTRLGELTIYQREVMFQRSPTPMMVQWSFDTTGIVTGFFIQPYVPAESHFLAYKDKASLRLPFKGTWLVLNGGRSLTENRHAVSADQRFAYDIATIEHGRTFSGDGNRLKQHFCFGRAVLAPGAGIVVEAKDGIPDNIINFPNASPPEGNHVVIDHGNGEYSVLAHFKLGSLKVKMGDKVTPGEKVGECGNSGNTATPHLHIHLQNTPVIFTGEGLPMQFQNFTADKNFVASGELERGQIVRNPRKCSLKCVLRRIF
ncbi:MAG: M23 family metallopeptidase [Candidatus Acidiferrales bacterium]